MSLKKFKNDFQISIKIRASKYFLKAFIMKVLLNSKIILSKSFLDEIEVKF